jgi:tryptophan synthase alpha chain
LKRISDVFAHKGRKALIAYITVGYPGIETTKKVVPLLAESGCDIVELGIPFSDPLADGATIQNASHWAIQNGVTPQLCLDIAGELGKKADLPLVFMSYLNPLLSYGLENFCRACALSSVDGLIIPDLPPDEGGALEELARQNGIDLIYLLPPTATVARASLIAQRSQGFIYLVSVIGVTGARTSLPQNLEASIARLRTITAKPLCVGFGISSPGQAREACRLADGVIIGSKIVQLIEADASLATLRDFVKEVRESLDGLAKGMP